MSKYAQRSRPQRDLALIVGGALLVASAAHAQLIDKTQAPNVLHEGINKSIAEEIGAGRGDLLTPNSSLFIVRRDPFRAIRRGRQLFQRKFTRAEGQGPRVGDGVGDVNTNLAIGAGLSDSCASCHGRPRGSAGAGGDVATRPDSRDASHLFGIGLKEMLADEITADLRGIRAKAISDAFEQKRTVTKQLLSKGINYGTITMNPDGSVDNSGVQGVDRDLRVRPFFHHGGTISIREFVVGALNAEMGLQAVDPDLTAAARGARITTPSGMILDGALDAVESARAANELDDPDGDGKVNEIPASLVDHLEFYLLNYFKPATYEQTVNTRQGRSLFEQIGCATCHIPDLEINHDRRIADVETVYDPVNGIFNNLFASAATRINVIDDGHGLPPL